MIVTTNNKPRHFVYGHELSEDEKSDFDYIEPDEMDGRSFVRYKGRVYDVSDFARIEPQMVNCQRGDWAGWHGYAGDTFFSGVLIRIIDSESCIMGTYFA